MARKNLHRPYTPDPAQTAIWPDVSGNSINGAGDDRRRKPQMVYWAPNPDDIPHGPLQRYFYSKSSGGPDRDAVRAARQKVIDRILPPVAAAQLDVSTADLNRFVENGACDKVGVAQMQDDWLFEGHSTDLPRIVMIGVVHDYDEIATAPGDAAGTEVTRQYLRAASSAKDIAEFLRLRGWQAEAATGPMTGAITMIPPALACGFGELGKHGSIITPEFGASFRLSAVLTDAPLMATPAQDHGIDAFCQSCRICEDACPPEALSPDKQTVRGVEKWYVDFDRCLPFFNETSGCAICIAVCPWSRPGVGLNLAAKLARRAERVEASGDA